MLRKYDSLVPADVRQFAQEIARLTTSGPIGAEMAARYIREMSQTTEGQALLQAARLSAKTQAESFGVSFGNVKIHTDSNADGLNKSISAKAFTTGTQIAFSGNSTADLLAHELTHVIQQGHAKGKP